MKRGKAPLLSSVGGTAVMQKGQGVIPPPSPSYCSLLTNAVVCPPESQDCRKSFWGLETDFRVEEEHILLEKIRIWLETGRMQVMIFQNRSIKYNPLGKSYTLFLCFRASSLLFNTSNLQVNTKMASLQQDCSPNASIGGEKMGGGAESPLSLCM